MLKRPLIQLTDLYKTFPVKGGFFSRERGRVHAVNGVTLSIFKGETLGLVGESGCGKSTLGLLALRLQRPDHGSIHFDGQDITAQRERKLRPLRRRMQMVFQDPYASLNPRMRIGEIVAEPLLVHRMGDRRARDERIDELLSVVGLSPDARSRFPHEFSGGQRQRIGIARAIALMPDFIMADEPVSALDVSIRGEIVNLLLSLQNQFGLTMLFVSHDLTIVEHISHRIAVMYLGKLMELFPADEFSSARHPYTQALVSAIPRPQSKARRERIVLTGDVPSPLVPPSGCPFHPRCRYAQPICHEEEPPFVEYRPGVMAACHFIREMVPLSAMIVKRENGAMGPSKTRDI